MAKIIKIKCNGPNRHVNEVDLHSLLTTTIVARGVDPPAVPRDAPERLVRPCRECTAGKVIVTREMIEAAFRR